MKKQRTALVVLIFLTSLLFFTKKGLQWFASDPGSLIQDFGMLSHHLLYMVVLPLAGWILLKSNNNT
jgi:hypothetical protein